MLGFSQVLLFPDGVCATNAGLRPRCLPVEAPTLAQLSTLVERISERVGYHPERLGLAVRNAENLYLDRRDRYHWFSRDYSLISCPPA